MARNAKKNPCLKYISLMHDPRISPPDLTPSLRERFISLLPFCAWRHLSTTPSCLPVPCCKEPKILYESFVRLYRSCDTGEPEYVGHEDVKPEDTLVGFVVITGGNPGRGDINLSPRALDAARLAILPENRITQIVYSGGITSKIHAQILVHTIATYASSMTHVWLHYDMYLLEAMLEADGDIDDKMRFNCSGQEQLGKIVLLQTTVRQEIQNLRAMHQQLPTSVVPPTPEQIVDVDLSSNPGTTKAQKAERARIKKTRAAFKHPQYVRPIITSRDTDKLRVHYINLAPIDESGPDVRIASPSARVLNWSDDNLSKEAMENYVYTPLAHYDKEDEDGDFVGQASLFNGDVILARLDQISTKPEVVSWVPFTGTRTESSHTGPTQKRIVRIVDEQALSHKMISAYAKRMTNMPSRAAEIECEMSKATAEPDSSEYDWSARDKLEDMLWKQRIGAIDRRPPSDPEDTPHYFVGIPNTYHFYRVLWYVHAEDNRRTIYMLPLLHYLMLKDFMGSCVPLHKEGDAQHWKQYKVISFDRTDDNELFDKFIDQTESPIDQYTPSDDDIRKLPNPGESGICDRLIPGYFSEYLPDIGEKLCASDQHTFAIYVCEAHIRALFLKQMRRMLAKEEVSSATIDAFVSKFDVDACWPAIDFYNHTDYAYIKCYVWNLPENPEELPDFGLLDFNKDHQRGIIAYKDENPGLRRIPFLSNLTVADMRALQRFIDTVGVSERINDPLSMQVHNNDLYIAFSPHHTHAKDGGTISHFAWENNEPVPEIKTRMPPQRERNEFIWPFNYYANGSLFFNNVSNINEFRKAMTQTAFEEAIPNLRILQGINASCALDEDVLLKENSSSEPFEVMANLIEYNMQNNLAFNIGRNDGRGAAFALEVYDAASLLKSAAIVTNLADPVLKRTVRDMSINALELVAVFGEDDKSVKSFEPDDALQKLGCTSSIEEQTTTAIRHVLQSICAARNTTCIMKSKIKTIGTSKVSTGIKFWGPPYYIHPTDDADVDIIAGNVESNAKRRVLSLWTTTGTPVAEYARMHDDIEGQKRYNFEAHSAIPYAKGDQYCLFAIPSSNVHPSQNATVPVEALAKKIGTGTYQLESMVLRDGVCDLRFVSGEVITVERAPSFASLRDTSIDTTTTPRMDTRVVDHGPPAMRSATDKGVVRTANLVTRVDRSRVCRVHFGDTAPIFQYLHESPTHLIKLTKEGFEKTSTVALMMGANTATDIQCMQALQHFTNGGVFRESTPLDRRILFIAPSTADDAEEVCAVVLLHIVTGGIINDADRLREIAEHPGSFICAAGPVIDYSVDEASRTPYERTIAEVVYHNVVVGDAWVMTAFDAPAASMEHATVHTATDGRCWNGHNSIAWNARMIQLHEDGTTSWNSGFTPHLVRAPITSDTAIVYHGAPSTFVLLTPPTILSTDLQHSSDSTPMHTRTALEKSFSLHDNTSRLSVFVTPEHNATLFIYVLLSSSNRSDVLLAHDIEKAVQTVATGVESFAVSVSTISLVASGVNAADDAEVQKLTYAQIKPVIFHRASRHIFVPGQGPQCLAEVRIGASIDNDDASSTFRNACVTKVQQIFDTGSVASFLFNCYEAFAVTMLNRRVDQTMRRCVIGTSDIGRRVSIAQGVLQVDGVTRSATWSVVPPDLTGVIEKAHAEVEASVTIRTTAGNRTVAIPNPIPVHTARPETLKNLYASALRLALEGHRA